MKEQLTTKSEDYGVEKSIAKKIEAAFTPFVGAMLDLEEEYTDLLSRSGHKEGERPSDEIIEEASELLKKYVKVRTGTAKAHKEQKDPFLQAGRYIDSLKNAQKKAGDEREEVLKRIKDFDKHQEQQRLNDLQLEREEEIQNRAGVVDHVDYAGMPDAIWEAFVQSAEVNHKRSLLVPIEIKTLFDEIKKMTLLQFHDWYEENVK